MPLSIAPSIKAEDTLAPFEFFRKNGHFQVGSKIFSHKVPALQYASRVRQPVTWDFCPEEFSSIKWQQRLGVDIRVLYRQRAQQLRDRYGYLMLMWSGGADSTSILLTFLNNNIPLDEVIIIWPVTASAGKYSPSLDRSSTNMMSEWDFSIRPQLERIKSQHPDLKITLVDMMSELKPIEDSEDTLILVEKHNFYSVQRYRAFDDLLAKRMEQYHDVATMIGIAGVEVELWGKWLCARMSDLYAGAGTRSDYTSNGIMRNVEYFYWTPDFPEIQREQAHLLLDHFRLNPQDLRLLRQHHKDPIHERIVSTKPPDPEALRQLKKSIFYPDYPINTFQVRKPKEAHNRLDHAEWFWSHPHAKIYLEPWQSCVQTNQAIIDREFLEFRDGHVSGYKSFYSRPYAIGQIGTDFQSVPEFKQKPMQAWAFGLV